jgi:hypothetical protein
MTEEHRLKIKNSNILNALIEHVEGQREMSATQVSAGLGLLRKVMPDLSQSSIEHTVKQDATDYSREELIAILERSKRPNGGAGTLEADRGLGEPDSVH